MALHTNALLLLEVDPALWEECVWVGKHVWVDLVIYGGHADDGLGIVRNGLRRFRENSQGGRGSGFIGWVESGLGDSYSCWYFPVFVVEGSVAGKALMSSNFTGTKSGLPISSVGEI